MSAFDFTEYFLNRGHHSCCLCRVGTCLHQALSAKKLPFLMVDYFSRYSPIAIWKIRRLIRENGFRIVHLHNPRDIWLISPALLGLDRIKLFATSRMLFIRDKKLDPLHQLLYSRLEKMINTTSFSQKYMRLNLPILPEKHVVIPNPVDLKRFNPQNYDRNFFRVQWQVGENDFLIGLVGRIDPGKGQKEIILALPRIIANFPQVKLVIVGEVTWGQHKNYVAELKLLAKELKIAKNIIWAGYQTQIPEILKALDLFVLPSYQESFGRVLVEAMAMNLPTIATNSGGPPEILDYGSCGILVPPRQVEPLADAVLRYLDDGKLRNQKASAGRLRAKNIYSINGVITRLEEIYRQSLSPKAPNEKK